MNFDAVEIAFIITAAALAASNLVLGAILGRVLRDRDDTRRELTKLYQAEARRQGIHPPLPRERGRRRADTTSLPVINPKENPHESHE